VTNLPEKQEQTGVLERVIAENDLSRLKPVDRMHYYRAVCDSLGLNPLTQPFQYIKLNGRLTLYATRGATDQLRKQHGVSVQIMSRENVGDVYVVTARATDPEGRTDESIGAVSIGNLKGDALANGLMKAETKAKRRVTLSIVGLGWLDETEIGTIPSAEPIAVDTNTGEIEAPPANGKQRWTEADRPYPADVIARALRKAAARDTRPSSEKQQQAVRIALNSLFDGDDQVTADQKRHTLTKHLWGIESSKELTAGMCGALLDWSRLAEDGADGQRYYTVTEHAPAEAAAIVSAGLEEAGQQKLEGV